MRIKLLESKWEHKIGGELANSFYDAIEAGDIDKVKETAEDILGECSEIFGEDEHIINEIEGMLANIDDVDGIDEVNDSLDELYDFCDGYGILIDVRGIPDVAEPLIGDEKELPDEEDETTWDGKDISDDDEATWDGDEDKEEYEVIE